MYSLSSWERQVLCVSNVAEDSNIAMLSVEGLHRFLAICAVAFGRSFEDLELVCQHMCAAGLQDAQCEPRVPVVHVTRLFEYDRACMLLHPKLG
jgi:hypothetical protein